MWERGSLGFLYVYAMWRDAGSAVHRLEIGERMDSRESGSRDKMVSTKSELPLVHPSCRRPNFSILWNFSIPSTETAKTGHPKKKNTASAFDRRLHL